MSKKNVMAIAAHPDDIEFGMAGTMILLSKSGFKLHYFNIANGSCGTAEHTPSKITAIRCDEAKNAASTIGAKYYDSIVNDLEIFYDHQTLVQVAALVRKATPQILLVPSPEDYMEDHQNAARLAVSAAFARAIKNYSTVPLTSPLESSITIYHAQPHGNRDQLKQLVHPEIFINIESVLTQKREMLACHKSQKKWLDQTQGMGCYLNTMEKLCHEVGKMSGKFDFAEGWRQHLHYGLCRKQDDPLSKALRKYIYCHHE